MRVKISISNRHLHLSEVDAKILFGDKFKLRKIYVLNPNGYFLSDKYVELHIEKQTIKLPVIGPFRANTQVEILFSDTLPLKQKVSISVCPRIENNLNYRLVGSSGILNKTEGLIVAQRHVHIPIDIAQKMGMKNNSKLLLTVINNNRDMIFYNIIAKISEGDYFECHLDMDEGCAAGIKNFCFGELLIYN